MNTFRFNLNKALADATNYSTATVNANVREDLRVWLNFLNCNAKFVPVNHDLSEPPLGSLNFFIGTQQDGRQTLDAVVIVGHGPKHNPSISTVVAGFFSTEAKDENNKRLNNKTATLEMLALLLPLLLSEST
jgi:hypothetical protein